MLTRPKLIAPFHSARAMSDHLGRRIRNVDAQAAHARAGRQRFRLDRSALPAYEQRRCVGQLAKIAAAARTLAYRKIDWTESHASLRSFHRPSLAGRCR